MNRYVFIGILTFWATILAFGFIALADWSKIFRW
jgi:hypothetical protein